MSSRPELKLDWCSYEAAKYAVEHWHYTSTMPMPPTVNIGVWEANAFIGVVIFSRGASPYLGCRYGLQQTEVCELTRVALCTHQSPVSRVLRIALKMLHCKEPGLRLVVSFADTNQGHHGGIYQASGWIYAGTTHRKLDYIAANGRRYRDRQVTTSGVARQFGRLTHVPSVAGCRSVVMLPKHRYLMALDTTMRARIEPFRKPYPKRAGSAASGTSPDQGGGGGATLTPALSEANEKG